MWLNLRYSVTRMNRRPCDPNGPDLDIRGIQISSLASSFYPGISEPSATSRCLPKSIQGVLKVDPKLVRNIHRVRNLSECIRSRPMPNLSPSNYHPRSPRPQSFILRASISHPLYPRTSRLPVFTSRSHPKCIPTMRNPYRIQFILQPTYP